MKAKQQTTTASNLGFRLWQAANNWQRNLKQALKPLDLTHVQYLVLAGLTDLKALGQPTAVNQNLIANHIQIDKMTASKVIRALAERQLLHREDSDEDARAISVWLTATGLALVQRAQDLINQADQSFFEVIDKKQDKLAKYLKLLSSAEQDKEN